MKSHSQRNRIWELDFFRGIALILMVYFHVIYDLSDLFNCPVSYSNGINYYTGKISVILFMIISAISCSLSRNNTKRGLKILAIALVITLATHLFNPQLGIKFGILHFLALSILIMPVFKKMNNVLLFITGTSIIILGNYFSKITAANDFFFLFNITNNSFISSDYYPLLPWFGVFLYGIILSNLLYREKSSIFKFSLPQNPISFIGKHTLLVYIIHQPLILAVLYSLRYIGWISH